MTNRIYAVFISLFLIGSLAGCGSEDEQTQQQQQKQQVQQEQQQQKTMKDTVKAQADTAAREKKKAEKTKKKPEKKDQLTLSDIEFNPDGAYSVQVEAWRSRDKASERATIWKKRGFSNAFVVKHGNEETGDIWFRVRLGKVNSFNMAKKLSKLIQDKYNEKTWIVSSPTEA